MKARRDRYRQAFLFASVNDRSTGVLANTLRGQAPELLKYTLQPHFLITAMERKLCSLSSTCFEHMIEMSCLLIGNVSTGPNHVFSMACRMRAWSGH